jgi:hypothetical protein
MSSIGRPAYCSVSSLASRRSASTTTRWSGPSTTSVTCRTVGALCFRCRAPFSLDTSASSVSARPRASSRSSRSRWTVGPATSGSSEKAQAPPIRKAQINRMASAERLIDPPCRRPYA